MSRRELTLTLLGRILRTQNVPVSHKVTLMSAAEEEEKGYHQVEEEYSQHKRKYQFLFWSPEKLHHSLIESHGLFEHGLITLSALGQGIERERNQD